MRNNNKTKIIALTGVSSAVGLLSAIGVAYFGWAGVILSVFVSIAVSLPILVDTKYVGYSLISYFVISILASWWGFSGLYRLAPLIVFALPFAIVKSYGETVKEIQHLSEDDFAPVRTKYRIPTLVRWILYYVLCEIALGVTYLVMYLFVPELLSTLIAKNWHWYLLALGQLVVPLYNILLSGSFAVARKFTKRLIQ